MSRALLFLFLASYPASAIQLPEAGSSSTARTQAFESRPLRLIDAAGRPLPAGTRVELRTEWHLLDQPVGERFLIGMNDEFVKQLVGPDGQLTWARSRSGPPHYRGFLHARPVELAETRSRAFVPWPVEVSSGSPIELKLEPERVLCSGRVLDELGKPIMLNSVSVMIRIRDPRPQPLFDPMDLLDAQVKPSGDGYVISGWPQGGPWQISAKYIYHGPESAPRAMDFGQRDVDLILPVTGHVQTQAKLPDPFPRSAL
jgi:hypothetical protein